jgi:hypothetical protein
MAQPTNLYDRYDAASNVREDLIDKITMTNPDLTPVVTSFGRATAKNTYHEWQRDALRAPNANNAAIDGDDATASAKSPPVRVANYTQIFQDTIATSGRANAVDKAGMATAQAYYKAKAYKELQRDIEAMVVSKNAAVAGSASVAMKAGGLGVQIFTNALHGGAGATAAHNAGAPTTAVTAGTNRAFTEALLKTAVQQTYTSSGEVPPMVVLSPAHKTTFSGFVGIAGIRADVKDKKQAKIVGGADVYVSDFGSMEIVPHYIMAGANYVYGLNPEYGDVVYLRGFRANALGKTGDSEKEQILVDATVRLRSENTQFKIDDLTP